MEFLEKLDHFKRGGYYGVMVWYGEGIGCDDMSVPVPERGVRMMAVPAGCIGEAKVVWGGTVAKFLEFDFHQKPTVLGNPPTKEEQDRLSSDGGWFIYGVPEGVEYLLDKVWPTLQGDRERK